jgi:hypothetical protein
VTLTGNAAFSSATSYFCVASANSATATVMQITYASGTSFTITFSANVAGVFHCIGN